MSETSPDFQTVENGAWRRIHGVWQQLYGSFLDQGASVEWQDFRSEQSLPWSESFHQQSLELCLNYSGAGSFGRGKTAQSCTEGQLAIYRTSAIAVPALREADRAHRFLTFEFSAPFLLSRFAGLVDGLLPSIQKFLDGAEMEPAVISLSNIPPHLLLLRQHLLTPPVPDAGRALWFESKITELLSSTLFRPNAIPEFFCQKHFRLGREIAEQVLFLLARDMDNPPSLEDLGRELDRSPFAISRIFSEVTGETIPSALRRLRLDRAGRLLIETNKSVTEIAFEVGYSSIGSFNKAFGQHFGCVPTAYRTSRPKA